MKVSEFNANTLMLCNELTHASKQATPETWESELRVVLERHGIPFEMLGHLQQG